MRSVLGFIAVLFLTTLGATLGVRTSVVAQAPNSPAWAYGVEPDAPLVTTPPPPPATPATPRAPDTSLKRIPGSTKDFTLAHIRDFWDVVAYVPPGSLQKGAALVASGGGKTVPCGVCHGVDLNGLGPVPGIAGRSPSYLMRQLWDIKQGTRKGAWSPLMKPVVENLTQDDMLAIVAYVASQGR